MKCIIVDDEPLAREAIQLLVSKRPDLQLIGSYNSANGASTFLEENAVDLIFLDIQMPRLTGLELLSALKNPPAVVLTTAYREYAVESYDHDVLDYLVKPIQFDRFLKSIGRYYQRQSAQNATVQPAPDAFEQAYLFFRIDREQQKVWLKDIQYIEGLGDYVKIYTETGPLITYERLSYLEEKLPEEHFIRIHKSYIICLDKMQSFSGTEVKIAGKRLPVGRMYKDRLGKIG